MPNRISIEQKVLSENDRFAARIRESLNRESVVALNLISSPGAGKTSLLERTLGELRGKIRLGLIAGDVQTENDAKRLQAAGAEVVRPLVTGGACHLDARMISTLLPEIELSQLDLLILENVGNLVCPAGYDLGENMKVVLISTTEGDDKPLKYPAAFRRSSVMIINKTDLLGTSDFSLQRARKNAARVNPSLKVFETSCRNGDGLKEWYEWLTGLVAK